MKRTPKCCNENLNCKVCNSILDNLGACPNLCEVWQRENSALISTVYNYKCPECNGEFNQPASNCTEEGTSIVGLANYRCPWCGFKMGGLNE